MNFPADLKYTKDHEWIRVDGAVAYIGITDYAQSELGEPELVNEDVYGNGWLIKISMSDPSELDDLLSAAEYEQLIAK